MAILTPAVCRLEAGSRDEVAILSLDPTSFEGLQYPRPGSVDAPGESQPQPRDRRSRPGLFGRGSFQGFSRAMQGWKRFHLRPTSSPPRQKLVSSRLCSTGDYFVRCKQSVCASRNSYTVRPPPDSDLTSLLVRVSRVSSCHYVVASSRWLYQSGFCVSSTQPFRKDAPMAACRSLPTTGTARLLGSSH